MTWFAIYEAYGTRPFEWGSNADRQMANTKDEELQLNLLNEGMRYRDLETGTFLTRDPAGYGDGPNVYCYVNGNPITGYDPYGLWNWKKFTKAIVKSVVTAVAVAAVAAAVVVAAAPVVAAAVGISATACAVVSTTATVVGAGMAVVGAVQTGESIYAVATGKEAWTGRKLEEGEREEIAGSMAGDAIMAVTGGAMAKSGGKLISKVMGYKCFLAGTLVLTATAGAVPIEDIKAGDSVLSYDFESGKQVYSEVVRPLERSYSGEIAYVQIGEEEIAATANHPFWVVDGEELDVRAVPEDSGLDEGGAGPSRWVCAGDLRVGDIVQLGNGSTQLVSKIRIEVQETTVYNIEVAGAHNYYVSGLGVLVHNRCGGKTPNQLGKEGEALATKITGTPKNTTKYEVNGRKRIPDQVQKTVDGRPTHVTEVKNVKKQSFTRQIKDDLDLVGPGGQVDLMLPPGRPVSGPLQKAFDNPAIPLNRVDLK
ncbi:MAG: hypothetical protein JXR40_05280 [Pontiellaceae bacterium]|nr:hypothetical protein [Pontiellaceae bacterium]